ncbi:MAG: TraR/DksA C4-type zinc finger protein [Nitrospirae bacterium]|nr:TraR/DksA C4-type zinc finger protein [Nitrospirota bacterium]
MDFHGHSCPGLALGYRVSQRALKELKSRSEDEEIVAIVENNSCAVDAVQVMTGCTFGKGNLIFRDYGKHIYTFVRRPSGRSIRIAVIWEKPAETKEEKKHWDLYAKGDRSKKVLDFVHSRKAARTNQILDAGDDELFVVTKGKSMLPPEAEIYESIRCSACGEKVAAPKAIQRDEISLCVPCAEQKGKKR